jgi:hypothetical protein
VKKIIGILILSMATCTVANAGDQGDKHDGDGQSSSQGYDQDHSGDDGWKNHGVVGAPEIDPASAMSGLTLLIGGLTVLRGRRTKK